MGPGCITWQIYTMWFLCWQMTILQFLFNASKWTRGFGYLFLWLLQTLFLIFFNLIVRTCEICHSIARNILGPNEVELTEQSNESNNASSTTTVAASIPSSDSQSFWCGHRFLNFLLACMVFAFVISWLFHFNVPS